MWPVAQPEHKRFKIFLSGPPGCFKSRVMLRLADNGDRKAPSAAIVDTEFGTKHYGGEFAFRRLESNDPDEIMARVKELVRKPENIVTLGFDSFSVYYDALIEKYAELFLKREISSAGNKGEYYTLQPRDYVHINREAGKLVRLLMKSDLNIILTCQLKDKWEGMKVIGSVFDGWKRLPYYFDTVIQMASDPQDPKKWVAQVKGKDRSNSLPTNSQIAWENDEKVVKFLEKKFGQRLATDRKSVGYDGDQPAAGGAAAAGKASVTKLETQAHALAEAEKAPLNQAPQSQESTTGEAPAAVPAEADQPDPERQGDITHDQLIEIVTLKKQCSINDPAAWAKLVGDYKKVDGTPHVTAKEFTEEQADEFIKDLIRLRENPTSLNSGTAGKPSTP